MKRSPSIQGQYAPALNRILTEVGKDCLVRAALFPNERVPLTADVAINVDAVASTPDPIAMPDASAVSEVVVIGPPGDGLISAYTGGEPGTCALDFRFFSGGDTEPRLQAWQQTLQHPPPVAQTIVCLAPAAAVAHGITLNAQPVPAALLDLALSLQYMHDVRGAAVMLSGVLSSQSAAVWSKMLAGDHGAGQGENSATWLCIDDLATLIDLNEILNELPGNTTHIGLDHRALAASYIQHFMSDPMRILPDFSSLPGAARFLRAAEARVAQVAAEHNLSVFSTPITTRYEVDSSEQADANIDLIRDQATLARMAGCNTILTSDPASVGFIRDAVSLPSRTSPARAAEFAYADLLQNPRGKITVAEIRRHVGRILAAASAGMRQGKPVLTHEEFVDPPALVLACSQLWQWLKQPTGILDEGRPVNRDLLQSLVDDDRNGTTADISWLDTILSGEEPATYQALAAAMQGL